MKSKLSTRFIAAFASIIILAAIVGTYELNRYLSNAQNELTTIYEKEQINNLNNHFKGVKKDLSMRLYDYAVWDDLYYALGQKKYSWIKENATKFLYESDVYDIDLIYVKSNDNSYEEFHCKNNIKSLIIKSELYKDAVRDKKLVCDFIRFNKDLYMVAISPITTNDEKLTKGIYVMGKKLDSKNIHEIVKKYFGRKLINVSVDENKDVLQRKDIHLLRYNFYNNSDKLIETVNVSYSVKVYTNIIEQIIPNVITTIVGLTLIIIILIIYYVLKINKILNKIIEGIDKLSKGYSIIKIPKSNILEFDELVSHTNNMANIIQKKMIELKNYNMNTIKVLVRAIEAKDPYTKGHSERVSKYALIIARSYGIENIDMLVQASMLHDIGKIGLKEEILNKKGALTQEEYEIVKLHSKRGYDILMGSKSFDKIRDIIKQHHERYDGTGYPEGLKGEEICIEARIIGVADAFDAMTSDRPYRKGMDFQSAFSIIKENSGTQFDPKVVESFINVKDVIKKICESKKR
ncbi:HD domain-containing phosphohydrolase [Haloimpatiens sp. FM7330]|uniref:HD domain-containing phosphohydrolase n=1 Tax=Haloimpatiens sp. FM7330 TaxID=3298610 RepID=UPI0036435696